MAPWNQAKHSQHGLCKSLWIFTGNVLWVWTTVICILWGKDFSVAPLISGTLRFYNAWVPQATWRHHQLWQGLVWKTERLISTSLSMLWLESGAPWNGGDHLWRERSLIHNINMPRTHLILQLCHPQNLSLLLFPYSCFFITLSQCPIHFSTKIFRCIFLVTSPRLPCTDWSQIWKGLLLLTHSPLRIRSILSDINCLLNIFCSLLLPFYSSLRLFLSMESLSLPYLPLLIGSILL